MMEQWAYAIRGLAQTSSNTDKQNILVHHRDNQVLREILRRAYHPYERYYINDIPFSGGGELTLGHSMPLWTALLDELSRRTLSGNNAKQAVAQFMKRLTNFDADVFRGILRKDLGVGIGSKTILFAMPGLIPAFGVMLAGKYDPERDRGPLYMSLKLDGLRGAYRDGLMLTRTGRLIHGLEHLLQALQRVKCPPLDGELMVPGEHFNVASGKLRSLKGTPDAEYYVFDCPDIDAPFRERLPQIKAIVEAIAHPQVKLVKHKLADGHQHIMRNYRKAREAGYEGLVLKTVFHKYACQRSPHWLKLKDILSLDLQITGTFEGKGRLADSLGGFIVNNQGVQVEIGSGLSDELRAQVWKNRDAYIGKIIEVHYQEATPDGSLRLPRFKGFRADLE